MTITQVTRDHKSRLFPMIFSDRQSLLNLYNAVNGSHYTDPEQLIVNTMGNIIYMGMKNDLSFLMEDRLNLYEHQSTWNPNMPLRGLFYFADLYQGYVAEKDLDIYSAARLKLPAPQYIVFYNGLQKEPDRILLKLSDSFPQAACGTYALECTATMLNINFGHNQELMKNCRKLYEYSYLIAKIREFLSQGLTLAAATDRAIQICIAEGILADFLKKHRAEVKHMILTEYNEELHIRSEKKLSYDEGFEEGKRQAVRINSLHHLLVKDKRFSDLERATEDEAFQNQLFAEYGIE